MQKLIAVGGIAVVFLSLFAFNSADEPDPKMVSLAVRATVFAQPSPTIHYVEVTRLVEVTKIIEVTRLVEVTRVAVMPPEPTQTPVPTPTADVAVARPASVDVVAVSAPSVDLSPSCPVHSANSYSTIPIVGPAADRVDSAHGDLNLALRGYIAHPSTLSLVDINGPADADAPQLAGLFADHRVPEFVSTARVNSWNWQCGEHGCPGGPIDHTDVTLVSIRTAPVDPISIPSRNAEIYGGGFKALVLYADSNRITLNYTREDSVANGYSVHIEDICVDPNLLALYRQSNINGRSSLPGLHNGAAIGSAGSGEISVAIRDRGRFTDPRSRKDWWQGY